MKFLIGLSFFVTSALASAMPGQPVVGACEAKLSAKEAQMLDKTVPGLSSASLEEVYLGLKAEEARYRDVNELPPEIVARLQENFGKPYILEQMNPIAIRQFYLNSIRLRYIMTALEWKKAEALRFLSDDTEVETAALIIDRMVTPFSLEDESYRLASAQEFFANRVWASFPWKEFEALMGRWRAVASEKFSRREFSDFWSLHAERTGLTLNHFDLIASALSGGLRISACCKSTPGCPACPNNLRWARGRQNTHNH